MKLIRLLMVLVCCATASVSLGAGLAHNENFIVLAPDQLLADEVLDKADFYRERIANELFGEELPDGTGRTIINVSVSKTEASAFTWPIDSPERKFHKIWLTTSEEKAVGNPLRHELVHMLLNTKFPRQLPMWLEEGLASRDDDPERVAIRRRLMDECAQSGNWPDLKAILDLQIIGADDQAAYSVVCSLTEYLLSLGDTATLLRFGVDQKAEGWNRALQRHYQIGTLRQLQRGWREWVGREAFAGATKPKRTT